MDSRPIPDLHQPICDYDLGMHSSTYIAAAQAKLDQGNVEECVGIIKQGLDAGAEPASLLSRAHHNVLNGQKKLMAVPSAKKSIHTRQVNSERKMRNPALESSKTYQNLVKRKKFNWAPPVRPVKSTPSRNLMPKISIKKLEESPLPSSFLLDSPSPAKPTLLGSKIKFDENDISTKLHKDLGLETGTCEKPDKTEHPGTSVEDELKDKENVYIGNEGRSQSVYVKGKFVSDEEFKRDPFAISLAGPVLFSSRDESCADTVSCSNTSDTLHAFQNDGSFTQNSILSLKSLHDQQTEKPTFNLCEHKKSFQKISKTAPVIPNSEKSDLVTENSVTTKSPDALLGTGYGSGITSDRFSYHTDNIFSEKIRCNSDSGFQEVLLKSETPLSVPVLSNIGRRENCNNSTLTTDLRREAGSTINRVTKTEDHEVSLPKVDISGIVELPKTSPPNNELVFNQGRAPSDSFKKPTAPAIKLDKNGDTMNSLHNRGSMGASKNEIKLEPHLPIVKSTDLSDYLMQREHAARASSTTKKAKFLRIKKERYKVVRVLGKGGSGKVYEVENDEGKEFALKCVRLDNLDDLVLQAHINEINILWTLKDEPFIIKLYEYELKNENLFMLMEKGEMDLQRYLQLNGKLEDERIRTLWIQMLSAVSSIHKYGIIHTDLKPPNFLFVDSALKLIDFGIAKGLQDDCTSTELECAMGTLSYMAPESLPETNHDRIDTNGSKKNYRIRKATDIWSLGCILYFIVYKKTPFQHVERFFRAAEIKKGSDIVFPDVSNKDLLDTMKGCLKRNPAQRYSIDQLLAHPFVTGRESCVNETEKENNEPPLETRNMDEFIRHIKQSSLNSPKSLERIQKNIAKRSLVESNSANPIRKAIF